MKNYNKTLKILRKLRRSEIKVKEVIEFTKKIDTCPKEEFLLTAVRITNLNKYELVAFESKRSIYLIDRFKYLT